MNEQDQNKPTGSEDAVAEAAASWPAPGEKLRIRREELGLSHGRVAEALHMTAHYVKALENDEYGKLPGKIFVKGYLKSYARLLGLDVGEIIGCYEQFTSAIDESVESQASVIKAKRAHDQNLRWMLTAAVIIVIVVGLSWWFSRDDNSAASTMAGADSGVVAEVDSADAPVTAEARMANLDGGRVNAGGGVDTALPESGEPLEEPGPADATLVAAAEPVVAATAEAAVPAFEAATEPVVALAGATMTGRNTTTAGQTAPAVDGSPAEPALPDYSVTRIDDHRVVELAGKGSDLLEVHFSGASWIEVDDGDNTRLYNDMLDTGDDLTIRGKAPFNILVGDAHMVEITFNSEAVNLAPRIRSDNSARIQLESGDR